MSSRVFQRAAAPTDGAIVDESMPPVQSLARLLRWCSASVGIAIALAGCGGGDQVSPAAAPPIRLDQVAGLTLAQQSVNARLALPKGALGAVSSGSATDDFEGGMSAWSNWGNTLVVAGMGTSGSQAMQVGTAAGGAGLDIAGIASGSSYRLSALVKVSDPSETGYMGVKFMDHTGTTLLEQSVPFSSTAYSTAQLDLVAPANVTRALVYVWKNAGTGYAFVDDVSFAPPTSPPPPPPASNLVSNGGFESGMSDWGNWGNASVVSGQASSGSWALRVGTAAGGAGQDVQGIVPGTLYRLTAQAKVSDPSETVFVGVNLLNQAGDAVKQMALPITSTSYTTATFEVTAPSDAVNAVVFVWKNAGSGLGYVDDVAFGVAPGSAPPPPASNLLSNGGLESGMTGWGNWGHTIASAGQAAAGSYAAQVGTAAGGFGQVVTGVVAGTTYRASAQVKVSSPDELGYFGLKFTDGAGNVLGQRYTTFHSTAYSTVQIELAAPANATSALVYVWKNAGSGFAYADELVLAQVTSAPPAPVQVGSAPASAPRLAQLANGGHVVVWASGTSDGAGAILAQLFDPSGTKVGAPVTVFSAGSLPGVGALPDGTFLVATGRRRAISPGNWEAALFVQRVSATGQLLASGGTSDPNVNGGLANMLMSQSELDTAGFQGRSIYANADGSYVVAVTRVAHPAPLPDESLLFVNVDPTGSVSGTPVQISDQRSAGNPQLTRLSGGNFLLAGASRNGAGPVWWQVLTRTGQVVAPLQYMAFETWEPQVTTLADGAGLLTFHDQNSVTGWAAARIDANGNRVGTVAAPPRAGSVTGLANGGWVQTWISGTQLMAQYFAPSGQAVGDAFLVAENLGDSQLRQNYSVAPTPDGFIASYCVSTVSGLRVDEIRFVAPALN